MGWLYQALKEVRSLSTLPSPDIPCISFCGEQEEIVGVDAIEDRMKRWPGGKFKSIANAKHELLLEVPEVRHSVTTQICELFETAKTGSTSRGGRGSS